jgi:hypothetical protein
MEFHKLLDDSFNFEVELNDSSDSDNFRTTEEINKKIQEKSNPIRFMTEDEIREFNYPEATQDGVVMIEFIPSEIVIRTCKELAHAISYDTLKHIYDENTNMWYLGAEASPNPLDWDTRRIFTCPCYEKNNVGEFIPCDVTFDTNYILDQLPLREHKEMSKKFEMKFNRMIREHYLEVRPGGIDCVCPNNTCMSDGLLGIAYPIKNCLKRNREFEDNNSDNIYQCGTCGITFCKECHCQYFVDTIKSEEHKKFSHDAHSCEIMEAIKNNLDPNEKLIKEMTNPCPHCGILINIYKGCNRVTCAACHKSFCWKCMRKIKGNTPQAVYKHILKYHAKGDKHKYKKILWDTKNRRKMN